MLLMVKEQRDNGHLIVPSVSKLAADLHMNRRTLGRLVALLQRARAVTLVPNTHGYYHLHFPKYMKWQKMRPVEAVQNAQSPSSQIPPRPDQTRPDQTRPDQSGETKKPHTDLVDLYHNLCPSHPKVKKLTPPRISRLKKLWAEHPDLKFWETFFIDIETSDFLTGRVPPTGDHTTSFVAPFDWILKPANFTKIIEGTYANRKKDVTDDVKFY